MGSMFEQKNEVMEKWDELINSLSTLLESARKTGGTYGQKVGSMRDTQIKLRDGFK